MIPAGMWFALLGVAASIPLPNSERGPAEVVGIVAEALQNNNSPIPNAGVFTAYQFASPANRAATGPYGRFLQIVRGQESRPLIGRHPLDRGELVIRGYRAEQDVRVHPDGGPAITFRFLLSRQTAGSCAACWMVDGVVRVP